MLNERDLCQAAEWQGKGGPFWHLSGTLARLGWRLVIVSTDLSHQCKGWSEKRRLLPQLELACACPLARIWYLWTRKSLALTKWWSIGSYQEVVCWVVLGVIVEPPQIKLIKFWVGLKIYMYGIQAVIQNWFNCQVNMVKSFKWTSTRKWISISHKEFSSTM